MAIKIISFFIIILFSILISITVQAQDISADAFNNIKEKADSLKNIGKLPSAEDIGLFASTIRNVAETYQLIKSKIVNTINYCQNIIKSSKEIWEKIENGGIKIKKYIEDKIGLIYKKYSI